VGTIPLLSLGVGDFFIHVPSLDWWGTSLTWVHNLVGVTFAATLKIACCRLRPQGFKFTNNLTNHIWNGEDISLLKS
jgi:hypothetical protein